MKETKIITGANAIRIMRNLRGVKGAYFTLVHITCDLTRDRCGEIRKVNRCQLRTSIPDSKMKIDPDHYLTYIDLDMDEPRTCYKKLIRYVAFPPNYEPLKVDWFK